MVRTVKQLTFTQRTLKVGESREVIIITYMDLSQRFAEGL